MKKNLKFYEDKAKEIRIGLLKLVKQLGGGHIGGALSSVEILTALYYGYLNVSAKNKHNPNRDRFILSKGHGCLTLYYILADLGFFPKKELYKIGKKDGLLGGHPEYDLNHGIEATTGSLGMGLSVASGIALYAKMENKKFKTAVLLGDGECQEGSVWEAAQFAAHHKLCNLTAIVDHNKLQAIDKIKNVLSGPPLKKKWQAFGWSVKEINGHSLSEIKDALNTVPFNENKPSVIIARTVKGKGISYMENFPLWHYRCPDDSEFKKALEEIEK